MGKKNLKKCFCRDWLAQMVKRSFRKNFVCGDLVPFSIQDFFRCESTRLGKPCIIGTLAMARLGIATHPAPQMLSLADPNDCKKIMGWAKLEKMETFTPYPADPADWPRMEHSFWGKERRTWGGGHGLTYPPPGIRPPRLEEATPTPKDEGGECFFTQGRTLGPKGTN